VKAKLVTAALILLASRAPPAPSDAPCSYCSEYSLQLRIERNLHVKSFGRIWFAPGVAPKVGLTRNFPDDSVSDCDAARRNVRGVFLNRVWGPAIKLRV